MSNATDTETTSDNLTDSDLDRVLSIRLPLDLIERADEAAKSLNLKRADVLRLSLIRGIPILREQLEKTPIA